MISIQHFLILFQGFMTDLTNNNNKDELDKIPNYMEKTFMNNTNYNYIYVTDIYQLWGSIDFNNIYESLQNIIHYYNINKIICIGQSAGGYMSILFGNLLQANKILSFVPQINIFTSNMNTFRVNLKNKHKLVNFQYKNLNILQPFSVKTKIYICGYKEDIIHINNLNKNDTNLIITSVSNQNTHNIIDVLGKNKFIELIINEISTL